MTPSPGLIFLKREPCDKAEHDHRKRGCDIVKGGVLFHFALLAVEAVDAVEGNDAEEGAVAEEGAGYGDHHAKEAFEAVFILQKVEDGYKEDEGGAAVGAQEHGPEYGYEHGAELVKDPAVFDLFVYVFHDHKADDR